MEHDHQTRSPGANERTTRGTSGGDWDPLAGLRSTGAGGACRVGEAAAEWHDSGQPAEGEDAGPERARTDGAAPGGAGPPPAATLPAGRELDALVGQRVFGWAGEWRSGQPYRVTRVSGGAPAAGPAAAVAPARAPWTLRGLVPPFSADPRAALRVAEEMARRAEPRARQSLGLVQDPAGRFVRRGRTSPGFLGAATLPLAICRSALVAVPFFADWHEQSDRDKPRRAP